MFFNIEALVLNKCQGHFIRRNGYFLHFCSFCWIKIKVTWYISRNIKSCGLHTVLPNSQTSYITHRKVLVGEQAVEALFNFIFIVRYTYQKHFEPTWKSLDTMWLQHSVMRQNLEFLYTGVFIQFLHVAPHRLTVSGFGKDG